jgi:predicted nucleotidyltransferase component of viral defense system
MKMPKELYNELTANIETFITQASTEKLIEYAAKVKASDGYKDLWDMFHFANRQDNFTLVNKIYDSGCQDNHIYTALKAIAKTNPTIGRMLSV